MKKIYEIGSLIILGIKLQFYFLGKMLMGGILLGIFPAFLGTFRAMQKSMSERDAFHFNMREELSTFNKSEFIKINILGWGFTLVGYLLVLNLQIVQNYLPIRALYIFLVVLSAVVASTALHALPLFSKYELPLGQYVLQGFLCGITGIFETIAIVLGGALAVGICFFIPAFGLFLGIPMILVPYAWFSQAAVLRLERIFYKTEVE